MKYSYGSSINPLRSDDKSRLLTIFSLLIAGTDDFSRVTESDMLAGRGLLRLSVTEKVSRSFVAFRHRCLHGSHFNLHKIQAVIVYQSFSQGHPPARKCGKLHDSAGKIPLYQLIFQLSYFQALQAHDKYILPPICPTSSTSLADLSFVGGLLAFSVTLQHPCGIFNMHNQAGFHSFEARKHANQCFPI